MKMEDNMFPCTCGHLESEHPSQLRGYIICNDCFKDNYYDGVKQLGRKDCRKYVRDNIKFLEAQYERQHKH